MTVSPSFRPYKSSDRETCLAIFDANCPSFFAKFGAKATAYTRDGWGPGMDRVDMELVL